MKYIFILATFMTKALLCLHAQDWPQWLGPAGTGSLSADVPIIQSVDKDLKAAWIHKLGTSDFSGKVTGSPIITNGKVIILTVEQGFDPVPHRSLAINKDWKKRHGKTLSTESMALLDRLVAEKKNRWPSADAYEAWLSASSLSESEKAAVAKALVSTRPYSKNQLTALRLTDGKILWQSRWDGEKMCWWGMHATPCIADGVIYVVDGGGAIHARSLTDGHAIWKAKERVWGRYAGANSSPVIHNGVLYILRQDAAMALSTKDGSLVWKAAGKKAGVPHTEDNSPAIYVDGDKAMVIVPAGHDRSGPMCGFNAATGELLWQLPNVAPRYTRPVVAGSRMVIRHGKRSKLGEGIQVYDLTATPPKLLRIIPPVKKQGEGGLSTVVVRDDWCWYGTPDGLQCASLEDASIRWKTSLPIAKNPSMIVCGNVLIACSAKKHNSWYMIDAATGKVLHRQELDKKASQIYYSSPSFADGHLLIRCQKTLLCYDLLPKS